MMYPKIIGNLVAGAFRRSPKIFKKFDPATGVVLARVCSATKKDVHDAVGAALGAFGEWNVTNVVERGRVLREASFALRAKRDAVAKMLALETGRSKKHALGEVDAAVECGLFFAGEARCMSGVLMPSSVSKRHLELRRDGIGVGVLITPFNNPLAGIAWKLFPALLCGNTVVIKAHELTPHTPYMLVRMLFNAGVPKRAISILHGGADVGDALVRSIGISFVSFTGSSMVGAYILEATAPRLTRVSVESGGKNPFIVCDDADMDRAVSAAVSGAFVDAGQRCAATSRIIVFDSVYDVFKEKFLARVASLCVGVSDNDDYGAIISGPRLKNILGIVERAKKHGARLLCGGRRVRARGYFMEPVVFEKVPIDAELSQTEIFGPVVALYKVKNLEEAIRHANATPYLLSSAIHTKDMAKANEFIRRYRGGVVRVNGPTHGSEPHMPFGGEGLSGNGWREPGIQALDFYSSLKQVSIDPSQ